MKTVVEIVGIGILGFVIAFVVALLGAFPMLWLVNYLFAPTALVATFGTPAIGFWKAFWLSFLFSLAFKPVTLSFKS